MFTVFVCGFDTCINHVHDLATDQWLHQWRSAGFVMHVSIRRAASAHRHRALVTDKHIPAWLHISHNSQDWRQYWQTNTLNICYDVLLRNSQHVMTLKLTLLWSWTDWRTCTLHNGRTKTPTSRGEYNAVLLQIYVVICWPKISVW